MSLSTIIRNRQQALIRRWINDPLQLVQAESPAALGSLVYFDESGPGIVSKLGRRGAGNVAVSRRPGNPDDNASLWVLASYSGYRSAYLAFIREIYGTPCTEAELAGYDIDHLLNRARSPQSSTLIRIEAIPATANQEWGRLFEKVASDPQFFANQERRRRTMSWVICAKLAGQSPPRGPDDTQGIEHLVRFFAGLGLPAGETRDGLKSMLTFAYKFRR